MAWKTPEYVIELKSGELLQVNAYAPDTDEYSVRHSNKRGSWVVSRKDVREATSSEVLEMLDSADRRGGKRDGAGFYLSKKKSRKSLNTQHINRRKTK